MMSKERLQANKVTRMKARKQEFFFFKVREGWEKGMKEKEGGKKERRMEKNMNEQKSK